MVTRWGLAKVAAWAWRQEGHEPKTVSSARELQDAKGFTDVSFYSTWNAGGTAKVPLKDVGNRVG
jgi:hypothetical protein